MRVENLTGAAKLITDIAQKMMDEVNADRAYWQDMMNLPYRDRADAPSYRLGYVDALADLLDALDRSEETEDA